eukprot:CAMPEP_0172306234 /NCGR_PEP_ID=MMETSP1058-20130122/7344_1 /TAXON_ID=83371 /ORGANISM="Detonula confervacea, Strain CCMP 353" /LENGTH=421 /DNA_ID=CAMNT_0013018047 /DNA_START=252 /DNA_END=1513 /DNA_ORIENTATION=+
MVKAKKVEIGSSSSAHATHKKIKVGRISGYPIVVSQGKGEHAAIMLGCETDPEEFIACNINGKVKIRWTMAGYNDTVPARDICLQQGSSAPPVRFAATVASAKMRRGGVEKGANAQTIKDKVKMEKVNPTYNADTDDEDDRKPPAVTSGVDINADDTEYDYDTDDNKVKGANIEAEGKNTTNAAEDDRKPSAVTSGANTKAGDTRYGYDTDDDEVEGANINVEEQKTSNAAEDDRKPPAVTSGANTKADDTTYAYDTDDNEVERANIDAEEEKASNAAGDNSDTNVMGDREWRTFVSRHGSNAFKARTGYEPEDVYGVKRWKDPNTPKKAKSVYQYFSKRNRASFENANTSADSSETTKRLRRAFGDLDAETKEEYEAMAKIDKERYEKEMKEYTPRLEPRKRLVEFKFCSNGGGLTRQLV